MLSASSAERWLHCPGSVRLTENMGDTTSQFAEEGTLAHQIAELKLRKYFLSPTGPKTFTRQMNKLKKHELYQEEMQGYTDQYVDYIKDIANSPPSSPTVAVELRVDFSNIVPEGFGTADCVLLHGKDLYVIDFKYGKGVLVPIENNPQLKLYAFGALQHYRLIYDIDTIHMTIVQPRGDGIKETEISAEDLCNWMAFEVKPAANKAYDGCDEFTAGDWCRFCPAHGKCRNASSIVSAVEGFAGKLPPLLSDAEVADILSRIDPLVKYAEKVKLYALQTLLDGGEIPGYKAVEGRSVRAFADQEKAFAALSDGGIDEALLWHREPYSLAQIEKQVGRKPFQELVGGLITKQPGKPTVVPASDPRKDIRQVSVENDFQQLI